MSAFADRLFERAEQAYEQGHLPEAEGLLRMLLGRSLRDVQVTYLLGHLRQPGLLPGEPGGPVRDRGRAGHHPGVRHQPRVALLVGTLAGDRQVSTGRSERSHQPVHVPAQRPAIRRHSGRINQDSWRHGQSRSLPGHLARARG